MRRMCLAMVVVCGWSICVLAAGLPDPGLVGTLASENRRVTIVSPLVNFSLTELQTLDARLDRTFFVADWIGVLRIDKRDEYTFTLESAGCTAALNLDGKTVDNVRWRTCYCGSLPTQFRRGQAAIDVVVGGFPTGACAGWVAWTSCVTAGDYE